MIGLFIIAMIGGIVERTETKPLAMLATRPQGFPIAEKQAAKSQNNERTTSNAAIIPTTPEHNHPTTSYNTNTEEDYEKSNNAQIASMSLEEIKAAQAEIASLLSDKTIDYLRSKAHPTSKTTKYTGKKHTNDVPRESKHNTRT